MGVFTGRAVSFIQVAEQDRALGFYCDTLGLSLQRSDAHGDFLVAGESLVRLTALADYKPRPHPVFGWDVDDIVATVRTLRERGVRFTIYDGLGQDDLGVWRSPDGKAQVAWFNDPDGNVLSLSQT